MQSLIREIRQDADSKMFALKEAEIFAKHCNLTNKNILHVRLLSEELLGMVGSLLDISSGKFWIDNDGSNFELHLSAKGEMGESAKDMLISSSKSGENAAYKGVTGKLRMAMDWLTAEVPASSSVYMPMSSLELRGGMIVSPEQLEWSMKNYLEAEERSDEKVKNWDELERSVLGRLSDDIVIGVRSNEIDITIYKKF